MQHNKWIKDNCWMATRIISNSWWFIHDLSFYQDV